MTPAEADALAKRIINTWRGGPPLREWIDTLQPLDAGTAGTAYIRLRGTSDQAPTIARYTAVYASLHTKPPNDTTHTCERCTDGWITTDYTNNNRPYRGVILCTCTTGQRNRHVYSTIRGPA
jgi:hypothetical protein